MDAVADALRLGEAAQPRPLVRVGRVAADDDDAERRLDVGQGGGADEDVDALEPLQPPDEERGGAGGEAQRATRPARSWDGGAGRKRSRSTPPGTTLTQSASAPYSSTRKLFSCGVAQIRRSARATMPRSASMRRGGSRSARRARFFTSPRVWNIATWGRRQSSARAMPVTAEIQ